MHAFYHWGGCISGIRRKSINTKHKVNSDDELHFFLHANQNICNLIIFQQNREHKHSNYGRFPSWFQKHKKCQDYKSETNMYLLVLVSLRSFEPMFFLFRQASTWNLRTYTASESRCLHCVFEHASLTILRDMMRVSRRLPYRWKMIYELEPGSDCL